MFHSNLFRFSLFVGCVFLLAACSSATSSGGTNAGASFTGTVQFTENSPVTHNVYMGAFRLPHDTVDHIQISNSVNLGKVADVAMPFTLTVSPPDNGEDGDYVLFSVWVDTDDDGHWNGEPFSSVEPVDPDTDPVFLAGDAVFIHSGGAWRFENAQGGAGELFTVHNKAGTQLVTAPVN